jgi:hypothetical protein
MTDIKSMKLYTHVERIGNELVELGIGTDDEWARHVRVHGEATVDALDDFYCAVDRNFQFGKLDGIRLCARRVE